MKYPVEFKTRLQVGYIVVALLVWGAVYSTVHFLDKIVRKILHYSLDTTTNK